MSPFSIELSKTLDKYFNALYSLGYISYGEVDKLILYVFIDDIINGEFGLIDEKDYKTISNVLDCIYGSNCLFPYKEYLKRDTIGSEMTIFSPRITESRVNRITESNSLRTIEK